jgi:hypothetical protein
MLETCTPKTLEEKVGGCCARLRLIAGARCDAFFIVKGTSTRRRISSSPPRGRVGTASFITHCCGQSTHFMLVEEVA